MKRGIIIADPVLQMAGGGHQISGGTIDQRIRYCLMYWDKIKLIESDVVPVINMGIIKQWYRMNKKAGVSISLPSLYYDISDLIKIGILELEKIEFKDQDENKLFGSLDEFVNAHDNNLQYFSHVDWVANRIRKILSKDSSWSVDYYGDPLVFKDEKLNSFLVADIAINNCLPVPSEDVNIADIIEFKERRTDELESFRHCLDELYMSIVNTCDIPRARNYYITKLNNSILNLNTVHGETWKTTKFASCKMSLDMNLGKIFNGAVTAGLVGSMYKSPIAGLFAGGIHILASSLKFEIDISKCLPLSSESRPELYYLSSMRREGFI